MDISEEFEVLSCTVESVIYSREESGFYVLAVRDTDGEKQTVRGTIPYPWPGETLTARQCQDIFRRFYRVDEARSRDGSYGLGLAIAERIVSDHRGRIWAEGKEGVNTFYVALPMN